MSDLRESLTQSGTLYGFINTIVYAHDYNDLTNKPQINGVTLTGNKTASELGLVTPATEAVQSVNGETGAVVLDGNDIAYDSTKTINQQIDAVAASIPALPVTSVNGETGDVVLDGSDIRYDADYTVSAKIDAVAADIPVVPVQSVNGETGNVVLDGDDIAYNSSFSVNQKIDAVEASIPVVNYPVTSVNSKTGAVVLDDTDIEHSNGVSVNSIINTITQYTPVYGNTASGAIATFDTSLALPLQDCTIAINGTNLTGAYIGYCDFNQLRRDDTTTNTADGITTKYDGTSHLVSITNNSRTTNYSSGSTQITLSNTAPIENHVYAYLANTDEQGVSVSQTDGNALKQTDIINTVFKGVSGATGFRLRVTNLYDFVSAHPINNTFSFYLNIIDLTQAFGETLAEYLYSLTDHGISIVKQLFTKDYYAYDAGGTKVTIDSVNGELTCPNAYVNWQTEAGTVSEGTLDVTTGKLTVVNGSMGAGDYQITPIPINQLSGTNNIFCDTGNTSVVYACSLKDYIDGQ